MKKSLSIFLLISLTSAGARPNGGITEASVRAHMQALASDAMKGRGSGTSDELTAAQYVSAQLKSYGIEPAGDQNGAQRDYIEAVTVRRTTLTAPYVMTFADHHAARVRPRRTHHPRKSQATREPSFIYGKDFVVDEAARSSITGPLQKVDSDSAAAKVRPGDVVLLVRAAESPNSSAVPQPSLRGQIAALAQRGAAAVMFVEPADRRKRWTPSRARLPTLSPQLGGLIPGSTEQSTVNEASPTSALVGLTAPAATQIARLTQGTVVHLDAAAAPPLEARTWNALGMIRGSDPTLGAILLSAHIDHLGIGKPVNGDNIYNGADDDASGVTAVLELAHSLAAGPTPKRTVLFAFFGSEELGGFGATYFRERPPVPLNTIAADLEFEMIGRADPAIKSSDLWLTGYDRSNLGPELAGHGAHLVPDPHLAENFFMRSDNYTLALRGVVAHTISSFGLHNDYHQPSDDLDHIDFKHMTEAIQSMSQPIDWLANSTFKPAWNPGQQPGATDRH